jgi:hypothetical protein
MTKNLVVALVIIALSFSSILYSMNTVAGIEYNVGVKQSDYIKYGNVTMVGPDKSLVADFSWQKLEVTIVSEKNVTIVVTGMLNNGTAFPDSPTILVYAVEKGTVNGSWTLGDVIIAANLNLSEKTADSPVAQTVVGTETRTYLGVSRTVNILRWSGTSDTRFSTIVYDKTSGIMLEYHLDESNAQGVSNSSYNVIETNIFTGSTLSAPTPSNTPSPSVPEFPSWIILPIATFATLTTLAYVKRTMKVG